MHAFFQSHLRPSPRIFSTKTIRISSNTMTASSLVLPSSISLSNHHGLGNSLGFRNGIISGFGLQRRLDDKPRSFMSVAVGSQATALVSDALFNDYKPTNAFLFPGQGAQAVGMGAEAQKVPAAADLYKKANDILGFDLLEICLNGPKDRLNSTVLSQGKRCAYVEFESKTSKRHAIEASPIYIGGRRAVIQKLGRNVGVCITSLCDLLDGAGELALAHQPVSAQAASRGGYGGRVGYYQGNSIGRGGGGMAKYNGILHKLRPESSATSASVKTVY